MKNLFILALICILSISIPNLLSAQTTQQQKNDSVLVLLKQRFNLKNADSLYLLVGDSFKKRMSREAFRVFAEQQLFPRGKIKESSLISFNNNISTYKLVCDSVTWQVALLLDKEQKLESFPFTFYKELTASSNPLRSLADKQIDTIARIYIQKINTVGLSIGILKNGKISLYNYGETKQGNGKLPNANTIFEIASITKTFTATLLAWYVNEGKIRLTDPITKFLLDSVSANKELQGITLLLLSNHSSGLPSLPDNFFRHNTDALNPYKNYNKQLLYTYLKSCKLNSKPGEKYEYSNLAVGLLGTILEQVSGKPFEQMVKEIICKPLGMKSTLQHLDPASANRFVTTYNDYGKPTTPWDWDALAACGAIRSTVNDLLLYAKANMRNDNSKLSKAFKLTHVITFNKNRKLGLAWHIEPVNNIDYYYHNGSTYGCRSILVFNTDKDIAVIALSNSSENLDDVGFNIIQKLQ